jgi:hypothetical protein
MPNWCTNGVSVSGKKERLNEFKDKQPEQSEQVLEELNKRKQKSIDSWYEEFERDWSLYNPLYAYAICDQLAKQNKSQLDPPMECDAEILLKVQNSIKSDEWIIRLLELFKSKLPTEYPGEPILLIDLGAIFFYKEAQCQRKKINDSGW